MSLVVPKANSFTFICQQIFLCTGESCTTNDTNPLHLRHIALAFLTAFLFATHLPERLAPGSFDYIGEHSHLALWRTLATQHPPHLFIHIIHLCCEPLIVSVCIATFFPPLYCSWTNHCPIVPSKGHSHQLFHVCGIIGTHFQMEAIEQDMMARRDWLLTHSLPITFANTMGAALMCVVLSLLIIFLFSLPLWSSAQGRKICDNDMKSCCHS